MQYKFKYNKLIKIIFLKLNDLKGKIKFLQFQMYIIKYNKFYFFFIKVGDDVVVEVFFEFFVCAGSGVLVVL